MSYCRAKVSQEDIGFYKQFSRLCADTHKADETEYYHFGYEAFGLILYGFCKWLINDLNKKGIKHILFCSRDGYIIQEAFKLMPGHSDFEVEYIYVSRRSLRVPLLHIMKENKKEAIFPTKYISINDLLDSVGLDPQNYLSVISEYQLSLDTVIEDIDINDDERVAGLINSVWSDVVSNSQLEYKNAVRYIESLKISRRVAIIDIGWRGSIQYYLQKMLDSMHKETKLHGYYITLSSSMLRGQSMRGYLEDVDENSKGCDLLRGYVGLIEMMFLKGEGSAKNYANDGRPILEPYEYSEGEGYTHEVYSVQDIQRGALDCVRDIVAESIEKSFSATTAFANLNKFANHPSLSDVKMFDTFRFFNNGTVSYLTGKNSFSYNALHPKEMLKDFYGSRWRIGFMKKNLMIPFPYYMLFQEMLKFKL